MPPSAGSAVRRYEAAGGVVVDPATGQVLVLVRPGRARPDGEPEVRLPKGHLEPGETRAQAALREVREETGLAGVKIVADLGQRTIRFESKGETVVRGESYFLMARDSAEPASMPETQFEPVWLSWEDAASRLTFPAEREWVRRARLRWEQAN